MSPAQRILGGETLSGAVLEVVRGSVRSNEHILATVVTLEGNGLVSTDHRILIATEEDVPFDAVSEDITDLEVRTGWWSRGISFKTSEGEFDCGIYDRDAVVTMGNIIRDHALSIDSGDTLKDSGGLIGRVKGVFDTATGQDIRKFNDA